MVCAAHSSRYRNLFAFEFLDRLILRRRLQPIRYPVRRKPNRARWQTGKSRRNRSRSDTGNIIDIALRDRGGGKGWTHDDQFHVKSIGAKHTPILSREERKCRDRESGIGNPNFDAAVLAGSVL